MCAMNRMNKRPFSRKEFSLDLQNNFSETTNKRKYTIWNNEICSLKEIFLMLFSKFTAKTKKKINNKNKIMFRYPQAWCSPRQWIIYNKSHRTILKSADGVMFFWYFDGRPLSEENKKAMKNLNSWISSFSLLFGFVLIRNSGVPWEHKVTYKNTAWDIEICRIRDLCVCWCCFPLSLITEDKGKPLWINNFSLEELAFVIIHKYTMFSQTINIRLFECVVTEATHHSREGRDEMKEQNFLWTWKLYDSTSNHLQSISTS